MESLTVKYYKKIVERVLQFKKTTSKDEFLNGIKCAKTEIEKVYPQFSLKERELVDMVFLLFDAVAE